MVEAPERAMRCTRHSVSDEEVKMAPSSTSSRRSSGALVRLPLCATDSAPERVLAKQGCALARTVLPAVE